MASLRRLFSAEPLTEKGSVVRLDERESHHGRYVLRLKEGAEIVVFDAQGRQYKASVCRVEKGRLAVTLGDPVAAAPETPLPVVLYLALAKGPAFESVLQRAVELGVAEIVPFVSERCVVKLSDRATTDRKLDRWRQILLSATKQCGRARLTGICAPKSFRDAIRAAKSATAGFCCVPDAAVPRLSAALYSADLSSAERLAVMIGPEGGLSPIEVEQAHLNGWRLAWLGPRTLRVETAATTALSLLLARLGEL